MTLTPEQAKARQDSITVTCDDCRAPEGSACVGRDGEPLHRWGAHIARLKTAGVTLPPTRREELTGFPHKLDAATQRARGRIEVQRRRVELEQRRRELISDARAGQLTETQRAEMIDLDATLGITPEPEPAPEKRDVPADDAPWMRGPGRTR